MVYESDFVSDPTREPLNVHEGNPPEYVWDGEDDRDERTAESESEFDDDCEMLLVAEDSHDKEALVLDRETVGEIIAVFVLRVSDDDLDPVRCGVEL